ncbi:MAG: hypothetical protein JSV91_02300 [Phycisphaerales bacterium]|nr:MAG: hypothetical protein JSV91_02300 [Phycisphaerales bacterium]
MQFTERRGVSLVGLLVTLLCILVLAAILITAIDKATIGQDSSVKGTVDSVSDQMTFNAMYQSMFACTMSNNGRYLVPSEVVGDRDVSRDTTANFYSAMIAQNYFRPKQLISANEYSPNVRVDDDYNPRAYSPVSGVYWDENFAADLDNLSNVSFAHMPLYGDRFKRFWKAQSPANVVILGNRGPKDGIDDPDSYSYGRNGVWGGSVIFGDGHIEFLNVFTPPDAYYQSGSEMRPDNIFAVDDGIDGIDSVLSFTKKMTREGPELQYD